ncbi:alpha-1,4-glucan--maltose-1-phosphate maltosyltransferase [Microbacterium excoecariae]|uniref:alpha-1,4-glucan--maltose-1-phosphate maltosyltransferase n=1 Tax=Microbacterium excoecariae TaxID=2715210 RepID=UPI0014094BDA|nr:alpha-1,4-glucan--maltose-1-phosphate maltosyltransferase [Microbacterium excoecariae]NHI16113.1 alpha-1,4-glucan--maltose-1-phosphate maltosyltransferase [Microbacterium excoecariae]
MVGRIPIVDVHPLVHEGARPAKAAEGEAQPIRATVFREGHDQLGAEVVLIEPDGSRAAPVRMREIARGTDRYEAWVTPGAPGDAAFEVRAYADPLATWLHDAEIKIRAGIDVELMFLEARILLDRVAAEYGPSDALAAARAAAIDEARPAEARLAALTAPEVRRAFRDQPLRDLLTVAGPFPLQVDRERALVGAWYEFFPRSEGARRGADGRVESGTFRTAQKSLARVVEMGFDVLYLPPVHPIGEVHRKGANNTLDPAPDDVGSPWAIGSRHGGHDAIHPDLGTLKDFDAFVKKATSLGLEVAMDFALQAAPDHPWVSEHPEFFTTRADGTIAYAENPPKKYQDIYPINFDNDPAGIFAEAERILRFWIARGIRIFRVDNPHTKPVAFWEWLLGRIRQTDPDVIFLSEAFTRPAMMHALGAAGFHQSYTYFTWRTEKGEIEDYLREVATASDHLLRPAFWPNTPDILHAFLQYGGPAAFRIRAALAALSSPTWGMYAGFELCEHVAVRPGSEEYLDSEKFQIRIRDWEGAAAAGRTIAPFIARLNALRREIPALRGLRDLRVHWSDDDHVLVFTKGHGDGTVIVVLNLDPHGARATTVHLDWQALGLPERFAVHEHLTGADWWWGEHNDVVLDPGREVAHVLTVRSAA